MARPAHHQLVVAFSLCRQRRRLDVRTGDDDASPLRQVHQRHEPLQLARLLQRHLEPHRRQPPQQHLHGGPPGHLRLPHGNKLMTMASLAGRCRMNIPYPFPISPFTDCSGRVSTAVGGEAGTGSRQRSQRKSTLEGAGSRGGMRTQPGDAERQGEAGRGQRRAARSGNTAFR
ncbi:hypothetical protein PR202_ga04196 [Eleusine coracana subsp. coracana]|uniref:Uncharacterized protein n=1 Tax=Eleusine coracana subsp. coracana TaxID=191504 RepID=A0AAV5BRP4_ELECO|nr:hypothetical protein PR202_ga04196 [Eleusine coracana subsp. coracana]